MSIQKVQLRNTHIVTAESGKVYERHGPSSWWTGSGYARRFEATK